ncbi:DUF2141 domain-containing protein [Sphingomonas morindae]|uniref:DUF2141 domain-containing protein n=1 Tax=Sphingomonas morindae TaxID=1541170 RepID=A0ABY4XCW0_9SPHN|nr:DUF2141 domain-containing protein [Sphingomonas morindae]USI74510.1 DUF2141 domain-containing protein [Sphingomonas morindae]
MSVSGTAPAAPIRGWARSTLLVLAAGGLGGAAPLASLDIGLEGLRSTKGLVQVCITADPAHFPACDKDPVARRRTVAAAAATRMRFDDLPSGHYAVALFHDENGNGRIDTRFGIPIEGVGFSNNPRLWFGPPSFRAAEITVTGQATDEMVKLRYFL